MDYYEPTYHIYLNNSCIMACLDEKTFTKEIGGIKAYLELTDQYNTAILDYVQCDPPSRIMIDGSY